MDRRHDNHAAAEPGVAELHRCPECASELVHPLQWDPVDMRRWRVALRCPECEWRAVGIFGKADLDRFDDILDAGTDAMVANLRRLQQANMEYELARFNLALGNDLILPEDF